jgi:hypothetical protein
VPVEVQLDVICPEGDARICPGLDHWDGARDITHQPAVVEDRHRAGDGSAKVCGLSMPDANQDPEDN